MNLAAEQGQAWRGRSADVHSSTTTSFPEQAQGSVLSVQHGARIVYGWYVVNIVTVWYVIDKAPRQVR